MEIKDKVLSFIKENKDKLIIISATFLVFTSILLFITNYFKDTEEKENVISDPIIEIADNEPKETISEIKVDIKGYVKNPGVYSFTTDVRVSDVIETSGGLLSGANTKNINLSKKVFDEMVIIIYSERELEEFKTTSKEECICERTLNDACFEYSVTNNISEYLSEEKLSNNNYSLLNINTASLEEFTSLNGVGESKAKAIIEYRETNGNFKNKEDLMEVSGIGESIYIKIKDLITTE